MIQLRVRTEFAYRNTFGPVIDVAERLGAMRCPAAAIVDDGTWGHVRWAAACKLAGVKPMFGTELVVKLPNGLEPRCWIIAKAGYTKEFYTLSSEARSPLADVPALLRAAAGKVFRFAGAALTDPTTFDYVDINPGSPLAQRAALALAAKTRKPLVVTGDNYYPAPADRGVFQGMGGRERTTPQHILDRVELSTALPCLTLVQFDKALKNVAKVAAGAANELPTAPMIRVKGDFHGLVEAGRKKRLKVGHIRQWDKVYAARLKRELELIAQKGYESYFLVVADLVNWAKARMLVGPGRGSSAGSLVCYLIGITEVDPIVHGLLFERFIDMTRADLPDIDIDFNDNKRDLLFDYAANKYGRDCVARIGNISRLKARSVIHRIIKRFGIEEFEKFKLYDNLIEHSSGDSRYGKGLEDTLTETEAGRAFAERHPEAMVMTRLENHADHSSIHAAGIIVANEPIVHYCTVGADGVAQVDKPDAETLNLLKIDALGLRTLGVIEDTGCVTSDQLYALPLNDPAALAVFNDARLAGVFQFEGAAQRKITLQIAVDNFRAIDHITALARPGPLGGGAANKYIDRKRGEQAVTTVHPLMDEMLKDTFGVVLYQEQVMRIVRELGGFSWEETTTIRKAMSGRKGIEFFNQKGEVFVEGAAKRGIDELTARKIWLEICSFGAWGMNMAHTCSYAIISYWCAYMKAHHRMEFAAACLRSAKNEESALNVLRELDQDGISYKAFDPALSELSWQVINGELVGGWLNLEGVGPVRAAEMLALRRAGKLKPEHWEKRTVKYTQLYPLRQAYPALFADPVSAGCAEGSRVLAFQEFPEEDGASVLYVGRVLDRRPTDANEAVRVSKRGGRKLTGPTMFLDLMTRDDYGETIHCRIDRFNWDNVGKPVFDAISAGDDVMVRGRRVPGYSMLNVVKLRCLNKPGLQWEIEERYGRWRS